MEQSPCWQANSSLTSKEIPSILWSPKVHYHVDRNFLLLATSCYIYFFVYINLHPCLCLFKCSQEMNKTKFICSSCFPCDAVRAVWIICIMTGLDIIFYTPVLLMSILTQLAKWVEKCNLILGKVEIFLSLSSSCLCSEYQAFLLLGAKRVEHAVNYSLHLMSTVMKTIATAHSPVHHPWQHN